VQQAAWNACRSPFVPLHNSTYKTGHAQTFALLLTYKLHEAHHLRSQNPNVKWPVTPDIPCTVHRYIVQLLHLPHEHSAGRVSFPGGCTQDFSTLAPLTSPLQHHRTSAAAYGSQSYRREFPCCCAHHVTRWNVMGVIVRAELNASVRTVFCS